MKKRHLSEAETRELIDVQLRAAGWLADTPSLTHAKGARPVRGKNQAIAEWPTESGPADYALFAGLELLGIAEAKKKARDVVSDLGQAKRYARDMVLDGQGRFAGGPWGSYRAPFLFATNGRPYLKQLEHKSGIWFLDGRRPTNHPRPLQAWYSPEGLRELLTLDVDAAAARLAAEPTDYLGLRDHQLAAVRAVEDALAKGKRTALLAMATGTGKTKTAIGLVYRLLKADRFRRILFLVDRNTLGEQAEDEFGDTRLEDLKTFTQIYDLKGVTDAEIETTTRVHISTVQALIRRTLFPSEGQSPLPVDRYDCIVVDEAHRGYLWDRELGEDELTYRNEADYQSKYRRVLEYFDAVKVALTATPAPHTKEIFGKPVFIYSYRQAVVDGWLVDHEPPHQIETKLKKSGIRWKKGDTVPIYDRATHELTNSEELADDLALDVGHFNKLVLTDPFNRTVARELVRELDPTGPGKTLVFAATDAHADDVVRILKEEFEAVGVDVEDDAIEKITGSVDHPLKAFRRFKNERLPNIAVTVDLLTTGIDVPEIVNLVFLRRVKSRILYEQMLGRATRRCDRIKKEAFHIFDAVGLYEALEGCTSMRPVVDPTITVETLLSDLAEIEDEARQKAHVEQILARLRRKARGLEPADREEFETLSKGRGVEEFLGALAHTDLGAALAALKKDRDLLLFLDEDRYRPRKQLVSDHADELLSHKRGYGRGEKPEDYLDEFKAFVLDNVNRIPALAVVCQRPRELTRQALKELRLALDQNQFTETALRTAWREARNEDIAADLLSFVRRQALGDPLLSHEERIRSAVRKVLALRPWTKVQRQWLERIEKQLLQETVIERQDFDHGAFLANGGYDRINKIFEGRLDRVLEDINEALYPQEAKYA